MPAIREQFPDASLHVVGRRPAPEVADLHGQNGCHVWGRVEDIRTWLKAADLALIPLTIARGVQNKVLEAMAMELPVVLTSGAATGIGAIDGRHLAIADDDAGLAARAVTLIGDRRRARNKGLAARRFVAENTSWQVALAPLAEIAGLAGRPLLNAA